MKLTIGRVKSLKPDPKGARKYYDGGGLHLYIAPTGGKLWRLDYRYGRKPRTLALGKYPIVGLADAREATLDAKRLLARGVDPMEERRKARAAIAASVARGDGDLWQTVAMEWCAKEKLGGASARTLKSHEWLIDQALPKLGKRRIGEITAPEILPILREIEAAGRREKANRLRALMSRIFRYGIATARCERDPAGDLIGALATTRKKPRAAVFQPDDVGELMRGIEAYGGEPSTVWGLKLLAFSGLRPGEVRGLRWSEIDWEAERIDIPPERMKSPRRHIVPMTAQIRELLTEAKALTGHGGLVLPAPKGGMLSDMTFNKALRSFGFDSERHVAHGFRRTFSTTLNEAGWNRDWVEAQLAHRRGDARSVYNAAEYLPGRRRMVSWYGDWLWSCVQGIPIDPPADRG